MRVDSRMMQKFSAILRFGERCARRYAGLLFIAIPAGFISFHLLKVYWVTAYAHMATVDLAIFLEGSLSLLDGRPFNNAIQHIQMLGLEHYARAESMVPGFAFHRNFLMIAPALALGVVRNPIVLQLIAVVLTGVAILLTGMLMLRRFGWNPIAVGTMLVLLMIPAVAHSMCGFSPSVFALPLLMGLFILMERRQSFGAYILALLFVLIREDYAIFLTLLGFYYLFEPGTRRFGIGLIVTGFVYTVFFMFIWTFQSGHTADAMTALSLFHYFGTNPSAVITNMFSDPMRTLEYILRPQALMYVLALLLPFYPILKRPQILVVVPMMLIYILSGMPTALQPHLHYSWPLLAFLFYLWLRELQCTAPGWRYVHIGLALLFLLPQNSLVRRPHFESNIAVGSLIARGHTGQRQAIEQWREGQALEQLLALVPPDEPMAIDLRARNIWVSALMRSAPVTILPRDLSRVDYVVRVEWPRQRLQSPRTWEAFQTAARLDAEIFGPPANKEWRELYGYDEAEGGRISLWQRTRSLTGTNANESMYAE